MDHGKCRNIIKDEIQNIGEVVISDEAFKQMYK